jgi:hypothetical protein
MCRSQLSAFLTLLPLALLAACGRSNPTGVWDGAAMRWEAAPPREIVDAAETDSGVPLLRRFDKPCTTAGQPWCCHQGAVAGFPLCSWKGLTEGMSATFNSAFKGTERFDLPSPLTLTSTTADRLGSGVDCNSLPVGFALQGRGIAEESLTSGVLYYDIRKDGIWVPTGSGGMVSGLVVSRSTGAGSDAGAAGDAGAEGDAGAGGDADARADASDGSLPRGTARLHADQCAGGADVIANVVMFDWVRFKVDDVDYEARFASAPASESTAFYVRVERSF